jgi:glycosyltransferase involved in cell wall biosynthesis
MSQYKKRLISKLRRLVFKTSQTERAGTPLKVCVPITQFPVPGGMRGVLAGVAQVMGDQWQIVYLTNYMLQPQTGRDRDIDRGHLPPEVIYSRNPKWSSENALDIELFGCRKTHPWQFPGVWLYSLAGLYKLFILLRRCPDYQLILPQDGIFTGTFSALLGRLAGVRVVCMDHGNITWLDNPALRAERMKVLQTYSWPWRILARLRFSCYWRSLNWLAWIATRYTDQFLIAGDEVEEVYRKRFGVPANRITRYAYMVDIERFPKLDELSREHERIKQGLAQDTILITLINRLAAEKGLQFALEGIALALATLAPTIRARVRVLIAGDGPLRSQVEADIRLHGLETVCSLWGEAKPTNVVTLLGISDIFLYSGTRGTNYSVAVLEAMAAGCAVVASVSPQSNAKLLAQGRGIAVAPGQSAEIGTALGRLCNDPELCCQMGQLATQYVAEYHTASALKHSLLEATCV